MMGNFRNQFFLHNPNDEVGNLIMILDGIVNLIDVKENEMIAYLKKKIRSEKLEKIFGKL
jgi:cytochrome c2